MTPFGREDLAGVAVSVAAFCVALAAAFSAAARGAVDFAVGAGGSLVPGEGGVCACDGMIKGR